jgi:hypothetical protein
MIGIPVFGVKAFVEWGNPSGDEHPNRIDPLVAEGDAE